MLGRLKDHGAGRQQGFHIALQVEEVDCTFSGAPLRDVDRSVDQSGHAHRLCDAGHAQFARGHAGIAPGRATQLEHPNTAGLARQVVAQHLHQAADQAAAHHRQRRGDRVQHADRVGVAVQFVLPAGFDKAEVDGFLEAQRGQCAAHGEGAALGLWPDAGRDWGNGRGGWQLAVADDPHHFLDQVFLDRDVEAPTGWRHRQHAVAFNERQAQPVENLRALRNADRHANDSGGPLGAQRDRRALRQIDQLVVHWPGFAAADVDDQAREVLDVLHRQGRVDTALEAVAGVGAEIEAARPAGDGLGPPECSLDVDVLRGVRHCGGVTAHDAGQRFDALRVGDHADLAIQLDGAAVQQLQRLAGSGPTHVQVVVDLVQVEEVRRPAVLEHHVIGDVDQRGDRALAATRQPVDHPGRRLRPGVHVAHDATREPAAQVGRGDVHW